MSFAHTAPDDTLSPALLHLGRWLQRERYHFMAVTPATHAAVLANRHGALAADLRDVFGWNLPFERSLLAPGIFEVLERAGLVEMARDGVWKARVRFSGIDARLFPHSGYPTVQDDAVFFGPDTYRFVRLIERELARQPLPPRPRILDVGCGSGAGGFAAAAQPMALQPYLVLADVNRQALAFARAAAQLAGVPVAEFAAGDLFDPVAGAFDLILANPPYLNDSTERTYRHGGGPWGGGLSERIVREGLPRLRSGGRLVLYTGSPVVRGQDTLLHALREFLADSACTWRQEEIDPDVFGEELKNPAYAGVERIAAIGLVVCKP